MFNFKKLSKLREELGRQKEIAEMYQKYHQEAVKERGALTFRLFHSIDSIGGLKSPVTPIYKYGIDYYILLTNWLDLADAKKKAEDEDAKVAKVVWAELEKGKPRVKKVK